MSIEAQVSIFTSALKSQFVTLFEETAEPMAFEQFTERIPSTARIEHYPWMSPVPGVSLWTGHRRYGKLTTSIYSVENKEFSSEFEVLLRDVEDDQVSGYMRKPKELAVRAKKFPGRWVIKHLAAAKTRTCFDGSYFVANSHTLGTGDNLLAYTTADASSGSATSAVVYKLAFLYSGDALKPLLYQDRKPPKFMTNAGTPQSFENKILRYWIDMEGEAAYGWWWDAVWVDITGFPLVTEMHSIFAAVEGAFRTFQYPKADDGDDGEYIHEQEEFSGSNLVAVGSTALAEVLRQAVNQDWVPQAIGGTPSGVAPTTNRFKSWCNVLVSAFMNP